MWKKVRDFFSDSETIFWARVNSVIGVIALIVTYVDPSYLAPFLPPHWFPWLMLVNGILTEYLRRRRDDDIGRGRHR